MILIMIYEDYDGWEKDNQDKISMYCICSVDMNKIWC